MEQEGERRWRRTKERKIGAGTGTGVETRGQAQDGNGDGSGDEIRRSGGDGNGKRDGERNEDVIGYGGGEAKKRKKLHKSCKRVVGNGYEDLGRERNDRIQESIGSVAAAPGLR